tara:strand:- start:548 stop:2827 length:2280 start_codon:yes stop_codon:yes gene_type:complete
MAEKQTRFSLSGASNWVLRKVFFLLISIIGVFMAVAMFSYSNNDPFFGYKTSANIENVTGYYGAYTSGTLLNYFDVVAFLIPSAFVIWGTKLLLGYQINYKIIKSLSLLFSILVFSTIFVELSLYQNIFGNNIYQLLLVKSYINFDNDLIKISINIVVFIILIPLVVFSLDLNNKYLFNLLIKIVLSLKYPLYIFSKILSYSLKIKNYKKIKINRKDPLINAREDINYIKSDDGFEKRKLRRKTIAKDPDQIDLNFNKEKNYEIPSINLLKTNFEKNNKNLEDDKKTLEKKASQLEEVLGEFGIQGTIGEVSPGPIVTMYELEPSAGTKASRIIGLADDIARSMSALSARISSQPGRNIIGIELPNSKRMPVYLSELLSHENYINNLGNLTLTLGKNIAGEPVVTDLEKMPHLLIAGTTGSGKSVGLNSMILSLLYKLKPSECRFILIDPKMLEFSVYEDIPHLMAPVVTDPHKAVVSLKWAVKEMENRYRLMNYAGVKNIKSYNEKINEYMQKGKKLYREVTTGLDPDTRLPVVEKQEIPNETFPYIVIVIDEMADLMMVAGKDVEQAIQRLAQMARAAGIHLIMATQRPSVDVITGTIKANFPSRVSYHVASKFDSRTILNETGAEQLLGSGDMLFMENGGRLTRLHGGFVSEKEISNVVRFIKGQSKPDYTKDITSEVSLNSNNSSFMEDNEMVDELYEKAVELIISKQRASTSFIQRYFQIGYNRAARLIEKMEKDGIVSEGNHVGKREVLKKNV